jgi:hypothetical protein
MPSSLPSGVAFSRGLDFVGSQSPFVPVVTKKVKQIDEDAFEE